MSYVDLMGDARWNEQQHVRRTEAMVRAQFSELDEQIINRKLWGAGMGRVSLTAQDMADIALLDAVTSAAQNEGSAARVDAALLHGALDIEEAAAALAAVPAPPPPPENPEDPPQPDPHAEARAQAQSKHWALLAATSPDVLNLVELRAARRAAPVINEEPQDPAS